MMGFECKVLPSFPRGVRGRRPRSGVGVARMSAYYALWQNMLAVLQCFRAWFALLVAHYWPAMISVVRVIVISRET